MMMVMMMRMMMKLSGVNWLPSKVSEVINKQVSMHKEHNLI